MLIYLFIYNSTLNAQEKSKFPRETATTIWNGSTWSNGIPNKTTKAIFASDYSTESNFSANAVQVLDGVQVNFNENAIVSLVNEINATTTGHFSLNGKSQLLQENPSSVNSTISITRKTNYIRRYDYTYFSSPVGSQQLNTIGTVPIEGYEPFLTPYAPPLFDKYYYWNALPGGGNWANIPETTTMEVGRGYIIRGPQSFEIGTAQRWHVAFTGTPNSGSINMAISGSSSPLCTTPAPVPSPNLIGNPYPASINLDYFLTYPTNKNTIGNAVYFWTHKIPLTYNGFSSQYTGDDYIMYNLMGGLGYPTSNTDFPNGNNRCMGNVATCQSFFVNGLVSGSVTFTEGMKDFPIGSTLPIDNNDQFYRTTSSVASPNDFAIVPPSPLVVVKNRIWLSISGGNNYKEALVGYTNGQTNSPNGVIPPSTNGIDPLYDAVSVSIDDSLNIYTISNPTDTCPKLIIQGRQLGSTFNSNDVVNIGFKCGAGSFTISSPLSDGLFANNQIFLLRELKPDGSYQLYDIKNTPYIFTTPVAIVDDVTRFQLVFLPPVLTQITNQCGTTLSSLTTTVNADLVPKPTPTSTVTYSWLLTANGVTISVTTGLRSLDLSNIPNIQYNTAYTIQVAPVINGVVQPFSTTACIITTPLPPPTTFQSVCGSTLTSFNSDILATIAPGAVSYLWRVTRQDTGQIGTAETGLRVLKLTNILTANVTPSNIPTFVQANKMYCVEVAVKYPGNKISVYSPVCCFNTGTARAISQITNILANENSIAFPNPFTTTFNLKLSATSNVAVEVKVYDMIGKLVDSYNILDTEIEDLEIGDKYNSGIYNVVINDGQKVFTQRIIKR